MSTYQTDTATNVRKGEEIELEKLNLYLRNNAVQIGEVLEVTQFAGGFSNLTYCLKTSDREYVLRRPPFGANIKSAHDMGREFKVLSLLIKSYSKVPAPVIYCEDTEVMGAPFYIMERLEGVILRAANAPKMQLSAEVLRASSQALVDNLVILHGLDIEATGLIPAEQNGAFLHNDYKYDNVIFNPDNLADIIGVLDWEMATVGDPLMDLGGALAYWSEAGDSDEIKYFNLTWLPGNLTRQEVINRYAEKSGRDVSNILFYYVFGLYKNAVIAQQIYARWKQGYSKDHRFGGLLPIIKGLGDRAVSALGSGKV